MLVDGNLTEAVITETRDRRNRLRQQVLPPRNNRNLNACSTSPLVVLAAAGNHDLQYISNRTGGALYVSKYASKADKADIVTLQNVISRKLAEKTLQLPPHEQLELKVKLRAIANAVISAQPIGTVQACYILARLSLVQSSRMCVSLNTLKKDQFTHKQVILHAGVLSQMDGSDTAISDSPATQQGKRDAFTALCRQQHASYGSVCIDFHSFVSSYTPCRLPSKSRSAKSKIQEGVHRLEVDTHGFITNAVTFTLHNVRNCCV